MNVGSYWRWIWIIPIVGVLLLQSCCPDSAKAQGAGETIAPKPDSITYINIRAVGDLMCHSPQYEYAKVGPDTFDFRRCYAEVKSYLSSADFTIGNIETVFAGASRKYTGYPMFNTPEDYLDAVKEAGFDFLVSANNHSLDRGESGALRTLEVLDNYGFGHTGTHASPQDRDSIRIVNINGLTMAILNYTYGTNGIPIPEGKPWIINIIDSTLIADDVVAARKLNPDLVTVFFHWGLEYQHEPCDSQRYALRAAISGGADIVLGSHPHVIQPVEYFKTQGDASLDSGFVIWSMGNFISNQYQRYCDAGVILNLKIGKNVTKDSVWIDQVNYLPTWVFRGQNPKQRIHTILPAEKFVQDSAYFYLTADWRKKMKESFEDTDKYLNLYHPIERVGLGDLIQK